MRERRAEHRARQADEAGAARHAGDTLPKPDFSARSVSAPSDQPDRQADAERREHRCAVDEQQHDQHRQQRAAEGGHQPLRRAKRSPRFQASSGPNGTTPAAAASAARRSGRRTARRPRSCRRSPPRRPADRACRSSTVAAAVVRNRLLRTSAPSREIGWNRPPAVSAVPRAGKQRQRAADEERQDRRG